MGARMQQREPQATTMAHGARVSVLQSSAVAAAPLSLALVPSDVAGLAVHHALRAMLTPSVAEATDLAATDLLPRIAAGEENAVRSCVQRYGALVWSLARRWSADASDAEDAVQEVFIDIWRSASRYDPTRASEAGWVAMLTRRRLIDRGRRRQHAPVFETLSCDHDTAAAADDDLDVALDRTRRAERALAIVRALPPAQRRLLELALIDGKTHDEIARETAMPLGTVKSHIRRGLLRARALLAASPVVQHEEQGR